MSKRIINVTTSDFAFETRYRKFAIVVEGSFALYQRKSGIWIRTRIVNAPNGRKCDPMWDSFAPSESASRQAARWAHRGEYSDNSKYNRVQLETSINREIRNGSCQEYPSDKGMLRRY